MSVKPSQTVQFTYDAGSNPGGQRLVYLESVDGDDLKGIDLREDPKDNFRHFKGAKIRPGSLVVVADANQEAIPVERILNAAYLDRPANVARAAQALLPDRKDVCYDDRSRAVVCRRTDLPRVEVRVGDKRTTVDFVNEDGKSLGVDLVHADGYAAGRPIFCPMTADDLRDFGRQLVDHFPMTSSIPTAASGWGDYATARAGAGGIYG